MAFFGVACAAAALITVSINLCLYGHVSSPYMGQEGPKFSAANYVLKIYQLFCDGTFLTGEAALRQDDNTHAVIERYPILLYLLPGVIYLVRSVGLKMIGLPLAIVASVGFYLTYSPTANPPYYWSYSNFHYLWWMVPWLLFFTYLSFRRAPFTLPRGLYGATLGLPLAFFLLISFKAVTVAASDSAENPLPLTTSYQNQTYTANLIVPKAPNIMDIRLEFAKPPSYPGTSVDSAPKTGVSVNGKPEHYMADYYMSQTGNTFDFSFLAHGLPLKPGDHLTLVFNNTEEPKLLQVSLRDVVFAPGRGAAILSGALVRIK